MQNNRYCEQCRYMNKSNEGYCKKMHCKVAKEKQTEQYIRTVSCVIEDWKETGERRDDSSTAPTELPPSQVGFSIGDFEEFSGDDSDLPY